MKKIKERIIRLLGGVTRQQCEQVAITSAMTSRAMLTSSILAEADEHYGEPADEWAGNMYEYIMFKHMNAPAVDIEWGDRNMKLTLSEPELNEEEDTGNEE